MSNKIYSFEEIIKLATISLETLFQNYREIYGNNPNWSEPVGQLFLRLKETENENFSLGEKRNKVISVKDSCDNVKLQVQSAISLAKKELADIQPDLDPEHIMYPRRKRIADTYEKWIKDSDKGFFLIDIVKKYCEEKINQIDADLDLRRSERLHFSPRTERSEERKKPGPKSLGALIDELSSKLASFESVVIPLSEQYDLEDHLTTVSGIIQSVNDVISGAEEINSLISERDREKENYQLLGESVIESGGAGESARAFSSEMLTGIEQKPKSRGLFSRSPKIDKEERKNFFQTTIDIGESIKDFNSKINQKIDKLFETNFIGSKSDYYQNNMFSTEPIDWNQYYYNENNNTHYHRTSHMPLDMSPKKTLVKRSIIGGIEEIIKKASEQKSKEKNKEINALVNAGNQCINALSDIKVALNSAKSEKLEESRDTLSRLFGR